MNKLHGKMLPHGQSWFNRIFVLNSSDCFRAVQSWDCLKLLNSESNKKVVTDFLCAVEKKWKKSADDKDIKRVK